MALPLFAVTLFVSAFLLFLVQPMIGKMILPKLGGTPQVWNTCMLFFQCALLAGYAYTHSVSTRLPTRRQLMVHAALLFIPLVFLLPPIGPFNVTGWSPDPTGIPVLQALAELAILVGVPFFVVSTSAPLLQRWFVNTGHPAARDPYFLYGASNLGSLLSLLVYPFLIEPWFTLRTQADIWLVGYVALGVLVAACIVMVWKSPLSLQPFGAAAEGTPELPVPPPEITPESAPAAPATPSTALKSGPAPGSPSRGITRKKGLKGHPRPAPGSTAGAGRAAAATPSIVSRPSDAPVTWARRLRWVLLAAVPSSLMLGVTSYISTDLSPFPLIWIVPLALYLLSFILVYLRWPIPWTSSDNTTFTPHSLVLYVIQPLTILALCWILLLSNFSILYMFIAWAAFFATALACHGELARDRPTPQHLTEYFLLMSVGGALGGFLNAIVAPILFTGVWEFYIALVVACFVRPVLLETNWLDSWLMNTFPSVQSWARDQSDQFSRSFGKTPDGSTYVLSYTLDVLLGLLMIGLVLLMSFQSTSGFYNQDRAFRFLRLIAGDQFAERYFQQGYYGVIYGIPLILCGLFSSRPVRFGLAITALLAVNLIWLRTRGEDTVLYQGRTYFGVLRVLEGEERLFHFNREGKGVPNDPEEYGNFTLAKGAEEKRDPQNTYRFTYLMHGTTYHGRNYIYREGTDAVDLSRLATTYYHRYGPVGIVMERFNWFPGPQNTYWGDARLPTAAVGSVMSTMGTGALPYASLVNAWSEIPYATIGLGTGTMASYCRPYQHLTYYEIDKQIRDFSLPPAGERAFFTYLLGAIRRGGNVEVIMGDARLSMENPRITLFPAMRYDPRLGLGSKDEAANDHPDLTTYENKLPKGRERYYRAINVDAFSSDAIPVHLVTIEAIRMYLSKLSPDGVLCVHTSNRHLDLVQIVARAVETLDEEFQQEFREKKRDENVKRVGYMVGKDNPMRPEGAQGERSKFLGQFSSEYVMVYFDKKWLKPASNPPPGQFNIYQERSVVQWRPADHVARYPWTDDYSNLVSIMR